MPSSPPDAASAASPVTWRTNLLLFLATVASVFATSWSIDEGSVIERAIRAAQFTGTLLAILVAHEFGHYLAARVHKVDASLPYFIPLPLLSPFGTMGAVIRMRGTIPTRRALLDIGASGPLAGLAIAIPLYVWGISHSHLVLRAGLENGGFLGESVLLKLLDHRFGPAPTPGMEIVLSPVAFGAWAGMFVTMINLLPVGQLDGGHVAYALFGPKQDGYAKVVHRAMLAFFFVSFGSYVFRDIRAGLGLTFLGRHIQNSLFWLIWFEVLAVLGAVSNTTTNTTTNATGVTLSGRTRLVAVVGLAVVAGIARETNSIEACVGWFGGLAVLLAMEVKGGVLRAHKLLDHPPTGEARLGAGRAVIAVVTLALFGALFMSTPFEF